MAPPLPFTSGTLQDGLWIKKVPSVFSPQQVARYLSVIEYEPVYDAEAVALGKFPVNLDSLTRLTRLHMLAFPFDNSSMHYTADHKMDVTAEGIFERFMNKRGGSYCFGQNGLLLQMLCGLGFRAYGVGGRVNGSPPGHPVVYTASNTHLIILVQPLAGSNQTYIADVGFGSSCITRPMLLSCHPDNVAVGLSETERHRLTRGSRPDSSVSSSQDLTTNAGDQWNMELWHKKSDDFQEPWKIMYSFTENEIFVKDCIFVSFGISQNPDPDNIFWNNVLCLKIFTVDEGNLHLEKSKRPIYRVTIFGREAWRSSGPNKEVLRTFETELDRIRALRDYFGVDVKDEDAVYIKGRPAAFAVKGA